MIYFHRIEFIILTVWASFLFTNTLHAQDRTVPNVTICDSEGLQHSFTNCLVPEKINIIVIWRGCCADGPTLLEELNDWITEEDPNVALLAVSCDNSRNSRKVCGQVRALGYEGMVLLDENQDLVRSLGVNVYPAVLFTRGHEKIVWWNEGYSPGLIEEIKSAYTKRSHE